MSLDYKVNSMRHFVHNQYRFSPFSKVYFKILVAISAFVTAVTFLFLKSRIYYASTFT